MSRCLETAAAIISLAVSEGRTFGTNRFPRPNQTSQPQPIQNRCYTSAIAILRRLYLAPFVTDAVASTENTSHPLPRQDGPFIMKIEPSRTACPRRTTAPSSVKKSPHWFVGVLLARMNVFGPSFS